MKQVQNASAMLAVVLCVFFSGCAGHPSRVNPRSPVSLRVMTWNIHHGEGMDGVMDLDRIAELIRKQNPDLVALQEVDRGVERTQHRDMPQELASLTGMTCVFSNNYYFGGGEYGNAILSKWPIHSWTNVHYEMLSPVEQRGALQVRVRVQGRDLLFGSTHLDAQKSDQERVHESNQLLSLTKLNMQEPIILCGDFNAIPDHPVCINMETLFRDAWAMGGEGQGPTIPVKKPTHRIDYIWLSKRESWKVRKIWVIPTDASDHLPVVADLELLD